MSAYDEEPEVVMDTPMVQVKPSTHFIEKRRQEDVRITDVGNYRSALVNTRHVDVSSLLTHVGGSSLVVDYYKSILDSDDEATPFTTDSDGAYQQYTRIIALELKVQTPIDASQYSEEGDSFSATGVAIIYSGLKPNVADLFLADIGDGRIGLLTVTKATPLSYLKNAVYSIEYRIHKFVNASITEALEEKTISTVYFDLDDLRKGGNGILTEPQVLNYERLHKALSTIATYHLTSFHNTSVESLVLAKDASLIYDPYIPGVMRDILDPELLMGLPRNRELNCKDIDAERVISIWDVLLENTIEQLPFIHNDVTQVSVSTFPQHPQFASVMYSGVTDVNVLTKFIHPAEPLLESLKGILEPEEEEEPLIPLEPSTPTVKPKIHSVNSTGYILSNFFYTQDWDNMSQLECLVTNYLNGKIINVKTLIEFIAEVLKWTKEEQYYLIPVLIILGNVAQRQRSVS